MNRLNADLLLSFNTTLSILSGFEKRKYAAEIALKYFDGSPYKMERQLNVGRDMVYKGLMERRTGIRCIDGYNQRGRKKKKKNLKD